MEIEERTERVINIEIEAEEGAVAKGFSRMYVSTKEEFERHCLTHLPYRNWCPICVQSEKRNSPHRANKISRGIPAYSIDYMFLLGRETLSNPILVMTESESGGIWAIPVKRKGSYSSYVSQRIANIIQRIGYARCIIKCDQEPAIIDVTKEVKTSLFRELQE